MKDRGLDFVDMFTVKAGYGYGVSAGTSGLVFYVSAGASWERRIGFIGRDFVDEKVIVLGLPVINIVGPSLALEKSSAFPTTTNTPSFDGLGEVIEGTVIICCLPFSSGVEIVDWDGKWVVRNCGILGLDVSTDLWGTVGDYWRSEDSDRFLDLTVHASVGIGIELGLSLVEMADFLSGWFGLDIKQDDEATDIARKKRYEDEVERLLNEFKNEQDPGKREEMLWENTRKNRRKYMKTLIYALLNDPAGGVRREAAHCLSATGDKKAIEPLKQAYFEDSNSSVRRAARKALYEFRIDPEKVEEESESEEEEKPPVEKGDKETS